MADVINFRISEAFFPRVYEGKKWSEREPTKYGLSFKAEELPDELRQWVRPYTGRAGDILGVGLASLDSQRMPTVVCGGLLSTTMQCARAANIRPDDLLLTIPMDLATETYEYESPSHGRITRVALLAIRIDGDHLVRRYDDLCARYFTG